MNIDISTPALLFPAIAILMLGYVNRYVAVAGVIRNFVKDYDSGYKHVDVAAQLRILARRIELLKIMLIVGVFSLILACASMLFIYLDNQAAGSTMFGLSIVSMIITLLVSIYETWLSNRSLHIEIGKVLAKEK